MAKLTRANGISVSKYAWFATVKRTARWVRLRLERGMDLGREGERVMENEYASAAKRIVDQDVGPWPDEDWTVLVALTEKAVGSLAWSTMTYRCEKCGFEWEVYLGLGVEGPPELKDRGLALPVPFVIGRCPAWTPKDGVAKPDLSNLEACEGEMTHVEWSRDRKLNPPELVPDDAPRFVLPSASAGGEGGAPCGRLEIPMPALVRARRSWEETR